MGVLASAGKMDTSRQSEGGGAWLLVALAAQLLLFLAMAEWRLIDGDEGLYLAAGRLMMEGRSPYGDFYWPQFPLMPLVYGVWSLVVGEGWFAARFLSALLASGTGTILFWAASRPPLNRRWGAAVVGLYLTCGLTFAWQPLAKTYALTTFLLVAAWAVLSRAKSRAAPPQSWVFLSGVLLGGAIATRMLILPCVAVFVVAAACQGGNWRERMAYALTFAVGACLGLAPLLPHGTRFPDEFLYSTLLSHADRNAAGVAVGKPLQKLAILAQLLGLSPLVSPHLRGFQLCESLQTAMLGLAVVSTTIGALWKRRWPSLAFWIVLTVGAANLLPTPTYVQYWTTTIPFAAFLAVQSVRAQWTRRTVRLGAIAGVLLFLFAVPFEIWRSCVSGQDVPVIAPHESRGDWRLASMREVAKAVDSLVEPGEPVLALWPGNLIGSHAAVVPGFENQNTFVAALHQSVANRRKYHLSTFDDFLNEIASHRHRLVIAGNYWLRPDARDFLPSVGYRRLRTFPDSEIELWWANDVAPTTRAPAGRREQR